MSCCVKLPSDLHLKKKKKPKSFNLLKIVFKGPFINSIYSDIGKSLSNSFNDFSRILKIKSQMGDWSNSELSLKIVY